MSEENQPVAEATPETTATIAPEATKEAEAEVKQEAKTFTQEELDAILQKRLAREQRKWERENQQVKPQSAAVQGIARDQFASEDEYIEAVTEAKLAKKEAQKKQQKVLSEFAEREEEAIEKYGDYDQVVRRNNALPITDAMADVIRESDIGPDIAYYLGTNPKEAKRISELSVIQQAKEIGKIEAKIGAEPPKVKKVSSAPEPISPVKPKNATPAYDLDDPRALKEMGTSAWIEAKRQQKIKELERKG